MTQTLWNHATEAQPSSVTSYLRQEATVGGTFIPFYCYYCFWEEMSNQI